MSESIYQSLLDPELAAKESPEAAWLATLTAEARAQRTWISESLAQAEFEEGLYCNEEEAWKMANQEQAELAADDKPPLKFPAHYHGGPWRIVLKLQEDGTPAIRVDLGPNNAEVEIEGEWVHVETGTEIALEGLSEPPLQLKIRILGEGTWMLWPR